MHYIERFFHVLIYIIKHPDMFFKAFRTIREQGLATALEKTKNFLSPQNINVRYFYYSYKQLFLSDEIKQEMQAFKIQPTISIVMPVYNVEPKWLALAIDSIERQWYPHWELCIVDDASTNQSTLDFLQSLNHPQFCIKYLSKNQNISAATNQAVSLSSGVYIALMDNDDELTPDALFEVVRCINKTNADFIYSDEDYITGKNRGFPPLFKPDYSPDLLLTHNYITHLSVIRRSLFEAVGRFRSDFDGAQDYDLFLRLSEQTEAILHFPKVLYHWRMIESSSSVDAHAKPLALEYGKKALEEALQRRDIKADVLDTNQPHFFRVQRKLVSELISIIIPFKDEPELLETCIQSILNKSSYHNFEIIGISNNSTQEETFELMSKLSSMDDRIRFIEYNYPFNYSAINNFGALKYAKGEHILLLNNDISVISAGWLEAMLEHSQRPEVACIGAKLYYPDDSIQHAGVIIGIGGVAGHSHKYFPKNQGGFSNRLNAIQNLSAVTGACLMVKKCIYQELGGLNELDLSIAFNDVDFCLRAREKGYLNVFTPYAELYHYESKSRGEEDTPEKVARFNKEVEYMKKRHADILTKGDPYYNPNLTLEHEDFSYKLDL